MLRPFRRPRRPFPPGRRPAARRATVRLRHANHLMQAGDYASAASIFTELADGAERRSIPRAGQYYLQAAHAWLKAGKTERALDHLHHGLDLLEQTGQQRRLTAIGPRIAAELREHDLSEEADKLEAHIRELQQTVQVSQRPASGKTLPSTCSSCGGSLRADEVEWLNNQQAACPYCGSILERE